jgi:hypothetical protein
MRLVVSTMPAEKELLLIAESFSGPLALLIASHLRERDRCGCLQLVCIESEIVAPASAAMVPSSSYPDTEIGGSQILLRRFGI